MLFMLKKTLENPAKAVSLLSEKLRFEFSEAIFRASYDRDILTEQCRWRFFVSPFLIFRSLVLYKKLFQEADV
jgi:hypothetical protein